MTLLSSLLVVAMLGADGGAPERAPEEAPQTLRQLRFLLTPGSRVGVRGSGSLEDPVRLRLPLGRGWLACELVTPIAPPNLRSRPAGD